MYSYDDELPDREIDVTISVTLSKTVTVKVNDYRIVDNGVDEDGIYYDDIDYSDCDLVKAVEDQIYLPQDAHYCVARYAEKAGITTTTPEEYDLRDWQVDDLEVVQE